MSSHSEKQSTTSKGEVTDETDDDVPNVSVPQNNSVTPTGHSVQPRIGDEIYEEVSEHSDQATTVSYQNVQNGTNHNSDTVNGEHMNTSDSTIIHENVISGKYEDVPDTQDYEPLKRIVYENTKNADDTKVYTGLDKKPRHSKVWDLTLWDIDLYFVNLIFVKNIFMWWQSGV